MKPEFILDASFTGIPQIYNQHFFDGKEEAGEYLQKLNNDAQKIKNRAEAGNRDLTNSESIELDSIFLEFEKTEEYINNSGVSMGRMAEPQPIYKQKNMGMSSARDSSNYFDSPHAPSARLINNAVGSFVKSGGDATKITNFMETGTDANGGFAILPQTEGISNILRNNNPIRSLVTIRTVENTGSLEEVISTDVSGTAWVAEGDARPGLSTPLLKKIVAKLDEMYSLQPISQRMIDDYSLGDLGMWLTDRLATGIAELEGDTFINGVASATNPGGLINFPTSLDPDDSRTWGEIQKIASGDASLLNDPDVLLATLYSLKPAHRQNSTWVMNSASAYSVMKMKDLQDNYIWSQDFSSGQPATLLGRPVVVLENLPDIGAGNLPIFLGNWNEAILFCEHPGIRLTDDPFSNRPYIDFYGYSRVGWALRDSNAIKTVSIEA